MKNLAKGPVGDEKLQVELAGHKDYTYLDFLNSAMSEQEAKNYEISRVHVSECAMQLVFESNKSEQRSPCYGRITRDCPDQDSQ